VKDPSLILYTPVRMFGSSTIVSNGDQTDTIFNHLENGDSFESALRTRTFEPDAPNYTPRISGIIGSPPDFSFRMCVLKTGGGNPDALERHFFEYPKPPAGTGRFLSTYMGDGNPLPSFAGEPIAVGMGDAGHADFAARLWDSLHEDNKISLFVKTVSPAGGAQVTVINKYVKA